MRGRALAIWLLFVMGSIVGCGAVEDDINRLAAIETCREMLLEAEAPGDWEDVDRRGVHLSVNTIHEINPEDMWEVRFEELPVSQSKTMDSGVEWAASIEIIHALRVTYPDAEEAQWIDARALCLAESNEGMHVTFTVARIQ